MTHFRTLGQKSKNNFVPFLVQVKTWKFAFEIYWPLKFLSKIINCFSILFCEDFILVIVSTMENGYVMTIFFKNIPKNWPIWEDGPNKLWGISNWNLSTFCHCVPRPWFSIYQHYFYEKLSFEDILKENLFGFGIWIWAAKN